MNRTRNVLGEVLARDPVRFSSERTGRGLNPQNLSVLYHVLQTGSRVCFGMSLVDWVVMQSVIPFENAIDEVLTRGDYGALPLSYDAA